MSQGEVNLRPARTDDRATAFEWLCAAYENPAFCPGEAAPDWEGFLADYQEVFFDQSRPEAAGGLVISVGGQDAGFISYDARFSPPGAVDLDIWMYGEGFCSQGYGTRALGLLIRRLADSGRFQRMVMCPSSSNHRAVRSYQKNGFAVMNPADPEAKGLADKIECGDGLLMVLTPLAGPTPGRPCY